MSDQKIRIVSDLDGTLTTVSSSWQFVLEHLGLWENQGENNLHLFLHNKITYDEFIRLDAALLQGIHEKKYLDIISQIPFRGGILDLFRTFKKININNITIVSSGLDDLALRLANMVPVTHIFSNKLHRTNGYLNGNYTKTVGWHDKELIMKQIKSQNPYDYIVAFGDTQADLPLIKMADLSFACFSQSNELVSNATYSVDNLFDAITIINKTIKD